VLLDHPARCSASGDEARPDHGFERHQELVDRQVHSQLGISVLFGERASCIKDDIDLAALFCDNFETSIHGGIIERIKYIRLRCTTRLGDFVSHLFQIRLGPSNEQDLSTLCREFLCNGRAN
jgi:hypothetical protein